MKLTVQFKPIVDSRRSDSFDTQRDMFMKIINQHFDEQQEDSASNNRVSMRPAMYSTSRRSSGKGSHDRTNSMNSHASHSLKREISKPPKVKRDLSSPTDTSTRNYIRPIGPELVSPRHPSCSGLPATWNYIHDRFVAYLATHAPLDKHGKVQRHEEKRERWRADEIAGLLVERFPRLVGEGGMIKASMVEKRLVLLDEAGDNDYFQMQYGAYRCEEWGRGI